MAFDKFENRCALGWKSVYAQLNYKRGQSSARRKRRIEAIPENKRLVCQECRGTGGEIEPVPGFYGQGPWYDCGWCDGLGYVLPFERSQWLKFKKQEKREKCQPSQN